MADENGMAGGNRHDNEPGVCAECGAELPAQAVGRPREVCEGACKLERNAELRREAPARARAADLISMSGTVTPTLGMTAPPGAVVFVDVDADLLRRVLRQAIDAGVPDATDAWLLSTVMEHRLTRSDA